MKPYGREKKINGSSHVFGSHWKKDYHLHDKNGRKVESWWEGIACYLSRSKMKQDIMQKIKEEYSPEQFEQDYLSNDFNTKKDIEE